MSTKLTIHDIARLAGVSTTTVSRVLNQSPNVDPGTRKRVLQVIEEQQFVPSPNAKGLKGHHQLIGLLMPSLKWTALLEVIWSVATYISEHTTYGIMLYTCPADKGYQVIVDQILRTNLVAGLLTMVYDQSPEHLVPLYQQGLPLVLIDPISMNAEVPWVGVDHRQGAYSAVRHLLDLGHRRIAYIQGPTNYPCALERYQGYCDALAEAGIVPDPELFRQGNHLAQSGRDAARALFALPERPTAIFAFNDELAYGVLQAADECDLQVPTDLALIGFNDDPVLDASRAVLTTVRQPFADMGRCACELLLSLINPQQSLSDEWLPYAVPAAPLPRFQLPTRLVIRDTSEASINASELK